MEVLLDEETPDIVSVVEHWCSQDNIDYMTTPGYKLVTSFCRAHHIHGGCAIYAKNNLEVRKLDFSEYSEEMICECVGIKLTLNNKSACVISVYRPPNDACFQVFLFKLYLLLEKVSKNDYIFICGDLNIDYLVESMQKHLLVDLLLGYNLHVSSSSPTRVFTNKHGVTSTSKVDYIITNSNSDSYVANVFEANFSDHRILSLTCKHCTGNLNVASNQIGKFYRHLSQTNIDELNSSLLNNNNFKQIYFENDIDSAFNTFFNTFLFDLDKLCPLKRKINNVAFKVPNWITPSIKRASQDLKNLHWLCSNIGNNTSQETYSLAKFNYNKMLVEAKLNFNKIIIDESNNKQKTVWNLVNQGLGRKNTFHPVNIKMGDKMCSTSGELANIFVNYFANVTEDSLLNHFGKSRSNNCTLPSMLSNTFFFSPVTSDEVKSIVVSLKNKKSSGIDNISTKILKSAISSISEHLAHLINLSVTSGKFPCSLKAAMVIPIYKKNDPEDISNYRPISILSVFSKVTEKIVYNRIYEFLSKFKILSECQHGFRTGKSTQSAAVSLTEFIYSNLDAGKKVAGLFFDLSRAFDSINFKFINSKLYNLGFRGIFLDWIDDYLSNRKILVRIGNCFSGEKNLNFGIPQGSVLGPLLFLLFINDMPQHIDAKHIVLFADDTSIAVTANTYEELVLSINRIMKCFNNWCTQNGLISNMSKTECIHFTLHSNANTIRIDVNETTLVSTVCSKFLGIYVDQHLRWTDHVDKLSTKLNKTKYAISRLKSEIPLDSLLTVYYSLVYSHLSYNVILWGYSVNSSRIFIAQKRIVRTMFNLPPRESCRPYFIFHKILTFPCIYILRCLLFIKNNIAHLRKNSSFHNYGTRNANFLSIPTHKTTKYKESPTYQGIRFYNHLPQNIQNLEYRPFKTHVTQLLLLKCYYSVDDFMTDNELLD